MCHVGFSAGLAKMFSVIGSWRLFVRRTMVVFRNYPAHVLEAIVVVSQCNENFLEAALLLTKNFAFFLSAILKFNAVFRLMLMAVISRGDCDKHGHSNIRTCCPSKSTWHSSQTQINNSCLQGRQPVEWFKSIHSVLHRMSDLCRCCLSVGSACLALIQTAPSILSSLCGFIRPTVSIIVTFHGCISPVLFTIWTIAGYSTQALAIIWDL